MRDAMVLHGSATSPRGHPAAVAGTALAMTARAGWPRRRRCDDRRPRPTGTVRPRTRPRIASRDQCTTEVSATDGVHRRSRARARRPGRHVQRPARAATTGVPADALRSAGVCIGRSDPLSVGRYDSAGFARSSTARTRASDGAVRSATAWAVSSMRSSSGTRPRGARRSSATRSPRDLVGTSRDDRVERAVADPLAPATERAIRIGTHAAMGRRAVDLARVIVAKRALRRTEHQGGRCLHRLGA